MERFRGDPLLADHYRDLEEKYGIKGFWYRNGNYRLPEKLTNNLGEHAFILLNYVKCPALVDEFKLHDDRSLFWRNYGALDSMESYKHIIYSHNRFRMNRINGLGSLLQRNVENHNLENSVRKVIKFARDHIFMFEESLPLLEDGYPRSISLPEVDTITDRIYEVCWALAEK